VRRVEARGDEIEHTPRRPDVGGDLPFHAWAQDLHHHFPAIDARAVHLAQGRGRKRYHVEPLEHRLRWRPVALDQAGADASRADLRHAVGEGADGGDVRLGDDVGAAGEQLRQLHEGGTEPGEHPHHRFGTALMEDGGPGQPRPRHQPAALVAPEAEEERKAAQQDLEHSHGGTYPAPEQPSRAGARWRQGQRCRSARTRITR
jgi:hypothetical protein